MATAAASLVAALGSAQQGKAPTADRPMAGEASLRRVVVKATELNGCDVRHGDEDVGDVQDLLVQPSSGEIAFAVVSLDGLEGVEDKTVALPLSFLNPQVDEKGSLEHVRLTGALEKVRTAPDFDLDRFRDLSDADMRVWCDDMDSRFGVHAGADAGRESKPGAKAGDAAAKAYGSKKLVACSDLMDVDVQGGNGEELGNIGEIAVDTAHGRALFFVVDLGGFLGIGEKNYALPWSFASFRAGSEEGADDLLTVPVTKEMLEQAPEFEDGEWKAMTDPQWLGKLYAYYRVEPYWGKTMDAGFRDESGSQKDATRQSGGGH